MISVFRIAKEKYITDFYELVKQSELKIKEIERNSENLEKALIAIKSVMDDLSKNEK
jgi:glutaredoxin 2